MSKQRKADAESITVDGSENVSFTVRACDAPQPIASSLDAIADLVIDNAIRRGDIKRPPNWHTDD